MGFNEIHCIPHSTSSFPALCRCFQTASALRSTDEGGKPCTAPPFSLFLCWLPKASCLVKCTASPSLQPGDRGAGEWQAAGSGSACCRRSRKVRSGWSCAVTSAMTTQETGQLCDQMTGSGLWNQGKLEISPPQPQGPHFLSFNSLTETVRGFHKASQGAVYVSWNPATLVS